MLNAIWCVLLQRQSYLVIHVCSAYIDDVMMGKIIEEWSSTKLPSKFRIENIILQGMFKLVTNNHVLTFRKKALQMVGGNKTTQMYSRARTWGTNLDYSLLNENRYNPHPYIDEMTWLLRKTLLILSPNHHLIPCYSIRGTVHGPVGPTACNITSLLSSSSSSSCNTALGCRLIWLATRTKYLNLKPFTSWLAKVL